MSATNSLPSSGNQLIHGAPPIASGDKLQRSSDAPPPFPDANAEEMADAEIISAFHKSSNELAPHSNEIVGITNVRRITSGAVVKYRSMFRSEYETMVLVSQNTTIPTPKAYRFIPDITQDPDNLLVFLCMEYIPGQTLDKVWPNLWWWQKIRIVSTLQNYVGQLHQLRTQAYPGPLGNEPSKCIGKFFTDSSAGPFASVEEMALWYNVKLETEKQRKTAPIDTPKFDHSVPLVLVHQDLGPHNVLLDPTGKLWIIDWGLAGFYPDWFEYGNMRTAWQDISPKWGRFMAGFIAGFHDKRMKFMEAITWSLYH